MKGILVLSYIGLIVGFALNGNWIVALLLVVLV